MKSEPDYTITELCEKMRISRGTLYTLISNGEIAAYQINGRWRIPHNEVETYKARNSNIKGYVYKLGDKVV